MKRRVIKKYWTRPHDFLKDHLKQLGYDNRFQAMENKYIIFQIDRLIKKICRKKKYKEMKKYLKLK